MPTGLSYGFMFPDPEGEPYPENRLRPKASLSRPPSRTGMKSPEPEPCADPFPPLANGTSPFEDCSDYRASGGCKIVLHQHYEGSRGDILRCKTCMRTFSSRRCGLLFKSRLASEVVEAMRSFYRRGESIRLTAKHLGLNRGTVRRYFRLLAREDSSV